MKYLKALFSILCMLMAIACGRSPQQPSQSLMEVSKQELAAAVQERDSLMRLVKLIADDMEQMRRVEEILTVNDGRNSESENNRLLSQMDALKSTLQRRRMELAALEGRLEESTVDNEDLKGAVAALLRQIDMQSREIGRLRSALSDSQREVSGLAETVDSLTSTLVSATDDMLEAERTASNLDAELNICHYAVGTKAELKDHNILETGFLRRSRILQGDFDLSYFIDADRRTLDTIRIYSGKCRVLTPHPRDSWHSDINEGGAVLVIDDPARFWSVSPFLVVQTD